MILTFKVGEHGGIVLIAVVVNCCILREHRGLVILMQTLQVGSVLPNDIKDYVVQRGQLLACSTSFPAVISLFHNCPLHVVPGHLIQSKTLLNYYSNVCFTYDHQTFNVHFNINTEQ